MKILHFYRTYFPDTQGGLEEAIRQTCMSTKSHGIESRILTLSPNPNPRIINFKEADVYRVQLNFEPVSCSIGVDAFHEFRELAAWADVIHYHFPWPFADIVKLWSRIQKPSIVTYHSDIIRQRWLAKLYRPVMLSFLQSATKIVATSPNYAESSPILQKFKDKLAIIPIGLDENSYPSINPDLVKDAHARYGEKFFIFIGVLREYKGLSILLEAVRNAPFPILIAGKGPQEGYLKQYARNLELNNVHFIGHVSDETKVALLHCSKGLVLPSHQRSEAFGVSLLEAAMMGKPMITTDIGTGTSFVNINNETGFVCKPADPAALRNALYALHASPELSQKFGENARLRYDQFFNSKILGQAYAELYTSLVNRKTTS